MRVAAIPQCHPDRANYAKGMCERCYAQQHRDKRSPETIAYAREYAKSYRKKNPQKIAAHEIKRRNDPEKVKRDRRTGKNSAYRLKYGITLDQVLVMLRDQGDACAICRQSLSEKKMHVDHCHSTGKVRGVLCSGCNRSIGLLGDNAEGLRKALTYLENFESQPVTPAP